jgi:hypothetical protein
MNDKVAPALPGWLALRNQKALLLLPVAGLPLQNLLRQDAQELEVLFDLPFGIFFKLILLLLD